MKKRCSLADKVLNSCVVKKKIGTENNRNEKEHLLLKLCSVIFVSVVVSSCTGVSMKSVYLKEAVQPIEVSKPDASHLKMVYQVPMESMYYSKGVDIENKDGVLKVFIHRCPIRQECTPMIESIRPLDQNWQAEVLIPHKQEKVIVIHSDSEQVVFP